jgi:hypothetical protein
MELINYYISGEGKPKCMCTTVGLGLVFLIGAIQILCYTMRLLAFIYR